MPRCIYADAVIEIIDHYILHDEDAKKNHSALFVEGMKDGYYRIRSKVINIPTADVRENIRGEWKAIDRASGVWACSVCGWSVILHSGTPLEQHCNFCTNCGADMQNAKQESVKARADEWSIDPRELEEDYLFLWEDVKDEQIH